jgi:hypothetical protein
MKPFVLIVLIVVALTLAACGGATTPAAPATTPVAAANGATPTPSATYLKTDYADATSVRNQLALGILKLEGTANAITAEQATELVPLWQAIIALSGTSTTAEAELTAVQNQIVEALQPAQLQAIGARQLTTADLNAFYAAKGIVMPTPVPGVTKVPGSGIPSADKEATRTAATALGTPTSSGAGQAAKTALFDAVIELLTARTEQ